MKPALPTPATIAPRITGVVEMGQHQNLHLNRYQQIANVTARHGLGYLVGVLGLDRFVPFHQGFLGHPQRTEPYTQPEHIRMAFEELGATFIKLGQILSTRTDLLSSDYQAEFAKLQDQAPPVPADVIQAVVVAELQRPIETVFAAFELEPLAAASIGQAHAATLPDGQEVVVKVRRPGIVEQIEKDLEILQNLAVTASHRWEFADQYDVVGLAQEFAQTLRAELDYIREGRNAERFAANFAQDQTVHIPRIFWDTTTSRVLTLERIRGNKVNDWAGLEAAGIDRQDLAQQLARINLKMLFEDGFFHADPHPGNFFIETGGRIGLIDFGMVGVVDARTQGQLTGILPAITQQKSDRLVDAFLDLGIAQQRVDRTLLQRDLERLVTRYYGQPLGELSLGQILEDILTTMRRHHLQLPSNLALLFKTGVMNEGLVAQIDPTVSLTKLLVPYVERFVLRQYSPLFWTKRLGEAGLEAMQWGVDLPRQMHQLLGELERGRLEVGVRPTGFSSLVHHAERLTNRIVLSIMAAAFINGLAILMLIYHPPGWERWASVIFTSGFMVASALGIYLVWSLLRK